MSSYSRASREKLNVHTIDTPGSSTSAESAVLQIGRGPYRSRSPKGFRGFIEEIEMSGVSGYVLEVVSPSLFVRRETRAQDYHS